MLGSDFLPPEPPREKVPTLSPSCFLVGDESCGREACLRADPPRGLPARDDCVAVAALTLFVSFVAGEASFDLEPCLRGDPPRDEMVMVDLTLFARPAVGSLVKRVFRNSVSTAQLQ